MQCISGDSDDVDGKCNVKDEDYDKIDVATQILDGINLIDFPLNLLKTYPLLQMQCFPLYSLLLALGNPTVNLFILDIEGTEYLILKTIPWDKVDIEVSTGSSRPSPGTRWTSRSVPDPQDHPLGKDGHRGQYRILKTIPWD